MIPKLNVVLVYNIKKTVAQQAKESQHHQKYSDVDDTYAEWDSEETIHAVRDALRERHSVTMIEADEHAFEKLRTQRPDIVFNISEGLHTVSREAQIPAMLEMLRIPYTGSDPLTLASALDKSRTKEILTYHSIATPRFTVIGNDNDLDTFDLALPCIVKPIHEGSSKGIFNSSVVSSREALRTQVVETLTKYNQPVLVEEFLEGREFTVALLGNEPELEVLPIIELKFDSLPPGVNKIYSYEAKWIWDNPDAPVEVFECPAKISETLAEEIRQLCRRTFQVMHCKDWCRVDIRLNSAGKPFVLELNPLPGILPDPKEHSCFPMAARTAGLSYSEMINKVLEVAWKRAVNS